MTSMHGLFLLILTILLVQEKNHYLHLHQHELIKCFSITEALNAIDATETRSP